MCVNFVDRLHGMSRYFAPVAPWLKTSLWGNVMLLLLLLASFLKQVLKLESTGYNVAYPGKLGCL